MIDEIILEMLYNSLTSVTIALISLFISFGVAFWLYKETLKTNAELQIYEIGREIAEILRGYKASDGPLCGFIDNCTIDENLFRVHEHHRKKAMHLLLSKVLSPFSHVETEDLQKKEKAKIATCIILERISELVPNDTNWSGKGMCYNAHGEDIPVDDKLFPFGTKLYREWISDFSYVDKDIWICLKQGSRLFIEENFHKNFSEKVQIFRNNKGMIFWLDSIEKMLDEIRSKHSRLVSKIQIIDNKVNEEKVSHNFKSFLAHLFLISFSGYLIPKYIVEIEAPNVTDIIVLYAVTIFLFWSLLNLVVSKTGKKRKLFERRMLYLPSLLDEIKEIKDQRKVSYRYTTFDNIVALQEDLLLPPEVVSKVICCSDELKLYCKLANEFKEVFVTSIKEAQLPKGNRDSSVGGFSFEILQTLNGSYDFESLCKKIKDEQVNFEISSGSLGSTEILYSIGLVDLSKDQREALITFLRLQREKAMFLSLKCSYDKIVSQVVALERGIEKFTAP